MLVVDAIAAEDVIRREVYKPGKLRQGSKRAFEMLDVDFARPFGRRLTLRHITNGVTIKQDLWRMKTQNGFEPGGMKPRIEVAPKRKAVRDTSGIKRRTGTNYFEPVKT